jgi:predicted RNase H-like HicB family nuclease
LVKGDGKMIQYKAGYKMVNGGVHAQVLDFPAAISFGVDIAEARYMLTLALLDVTETYLAEGLALPRPDEAVSDPEMDIEEPIYLHLQASTEVQIRAAGVVAP